MSPTEFCYWLQGFFDLSNPTQLSSTTTTLIKNKLSKVFKSDDSELLQIANLLQGPNISNSSYLHSNNEVENMKTYSIGPDKV
jgi:hypothetical protein